MPIQGEYMGMMLTIDDVDKENREFFRHCAEGTFHLQKGKESGLLRYPPTTACPWTRDREYDWVPVEGKGEVHSYAEVHHPIQPAFIDHGGFQCGICTPGMILTARALLARHPSPTDEQIERWMMGSLCRCTGYYKIRISIHAAAKALAAARDRPRRDSDAARGETV